MCALVTSPGFSIFRETQMYGGGMDTVSLANMESNGVCHRVGVASIYRLRLSSFFYIVRKCSVRRQTFANHDSANPQERKGKCARGFLIGHF